MRWLKCDHLGVACFSTILLCSPFGNSSILGVSHFSSFLLCLPFSNSSVVLGGLSFSAISLYTWRALVVQWRNSRLPRGRPGFDSRPMQLALLLAFLRLSPGQKKDKRTSTVSPSGN